jgi:RNA methyltransferase, TrmH family
MEKISSLHSPHIGRVKALLGSRGKKNRELENAFIAEGIQTVREALAPKLIEGLKVKQLFLTNAGLAKISSEIDLIDLSNIEIFEVTDQVMAGMADSESPQGILALCSSKSLKVSDLWEMNPKKIAYFWQIQDPGNAGTVIRTADACGFDAVIFSDNSVDIFNPKTIRATVGSLWHIPVIADAEINDFIKQSEEHDFQSFSLTGHGDLTLNNEFIANCGDKNLWIFGNEARGLPELPDSVHSVRIPMKGYAESLNVASAAAIVMHLTGIN